MFGADTRGQAIQIGAVILFSFIVLTFSLYQATVVPDQNRQVEFDHNQAVQQDMVELRNGVISSAESGSSAPTAVQLGTTYPPRAIAVNPGSPGGSLRTFAPSDASTSLSIENAAAIDDETADYWDGSSRDYTTTGIQYVPTYNVYTQAPRTVYENGLVYNRGPDGGVSVQTDQSFVEGRALDLTVLQGEYQRSSSGTASVDVRAPSNAPRTVSVQASGGPIEIAVPTDLSQEKWEQLLNDQLDSNGGYITDIVVDESADLLTITLQADDDAGDPITYELRIPVAGVGTGVDDPDEAYITAVSGDGTSVPEGGTQQVVAEVRNEFNGPESGVGACADLGNSDAGSIITETDTSDENGQVSFVYEAPNGVDRTDPVTVSVGYNCDGSGDIAPGASGETVAEFRINVLNSDGSSGSGEGGSGDSADQISYSTDTASGDNTGQFSFGIENTGSDDVTVTQIQISDGSFSEELFAGTGGNDREVQILVTGADGTARTDSGFTTDGSQIPLEKDAAIGAGNTANVDLNAFLDSDGNTVDTSALQQTSDASRADMTVTITFADGSMKEIYFTNN